MSGDTDTRENEMAQVRLGKEQATAERQVDVQHEREQEGRREISAQRPHVLFQH